MLSRYKLEEHCCSPGYFKYGQLRALIKEVKGLLILTRVFSAAIFEDICL